MSARNGKYGVEASYSSQRVVIGRKSVALAMAASMSRLLPVPAPPAISTMAPRPARAPSMTLRRTPSSASRPTSAMPPWCDSFARIARPTMDALTGSALPFVWKGGMGVVSKTVRERSRTISVDRIWPGSALLMTRAAVLMASPKTR